MARRKISNRGRVLAAGVCIGATGLLAGLMAATDDTGTASAGTNSQNPSSVATNGSGLDGSFDADGDGRVGDPGDYSGVHGQVGGFDADGDGRVGDPGDSFGGSSGQSGTSQQPTFPQPNTRSGGS
ncbi:MAG: hypothetical protein U0W40_08480 [Acidimicrobiia bacterium]